MLSPITQIGAARQIPLALFRQSSAQAWLRVELDVPESTPAANHHPSRVPLAFLRRLAVDDRLRAELEADPAETLARHGIHVDPESLPAEAKLPRAQAIRDALRMYCGEEAEAAIVRHTGYFGGIDD